MCGRYFFKMKETLEEYHRLREKIEQYSIFDFQQGEIFPSQSSLILLPEKAEGYRPVVKNWGIHGYKGNLLINARMEGIEEKYTFRPILQNRCVIVANGFYEWVKHGNVKDKIYIQKKEMSLFYMAGIYNEKNEFVIVTGESTHRMAEIHKRTPIMMDEKEMLRYLHGQQDFFVNNEDLIFQKV